MAENMAENKINQNQAIGIIDMNLQHNLEPLYLVNQTWATTELL